MYGGTLHFVDHTIVQFVIVLVRYAYVGNFCGPLVVFVLTFVCCMILHCVFDIYGLDMNYM